MDLSCLSPGAELLRTPEISPRSEPDVGASGAGPPTAGSVCHRHARAAAIHLGDPHQDANVPEQAQAGLHSDWHWHQVEGRIWDLQSNEFKYTVVRWTGRQWWEIAHSFQGKGGSGLQRSRTLHEAFRLQLHPRCRHDVLCGQPRQEWVMLFSCHNSNQLNGWIWIEVDSTPQDVELQLNLNYRKWDRIHCNSAKPHSHHVSAPIKMSQMFDLDKARYSGKWGPDPPSYKTIVIVFTISVICPE